jgi:hypothetical protein
METKCVLPARYEAAQLSKTTRPAKSSCRSYFQLTDPVRAYSNEDGNLTVLKRPASKRGGQRLLGFVCQDRYDTLGQIAFIDSIGFDFSAKKSLKKRAWTFQIGLDFHLSLFRFIRGAAVHFSLDSTFMCLRRQAA